MTTDDFTEAARAEAERQAQEWLHDGGRVPTTSDTNVAGGSRWGFLAGAKWARAHLAAQEPTDAEVLALIDSLAEQAGVFIMPLTASMALQDSRRAARRDEEKR